MPSGSATDSSTTNVLRRIVSGATDLRLSVFLGLLILLGGTSQPIYGPRFTLYGLSLLIILWVLWSHPPSALRRLGGLGVWWLCAALAFALMLIPLPSALWTALPGRADLAADMATLGVDALPWMPFSLNPDATWRAGLVLLPIAALLVAVIVPSSKTERSYAYLTLLGLGAFSAVLGVMQAASNADLLYGYSVTNRGAGVGVFSGANHQGTFLCMLIPLAFHLGFRRWKVFGLDRAGRPSRRGVFALVCIPVLLLGAVMTGSLAAYMFAAFTTAASALLIALPALRGRSRSDAQNPLARWVMPALVFAVLAALGYDAMTAGSALEDFARATSDENQVLRPEIFRRTFDAISTYRWAGSGPGTFEAVYRSVESRETLTTTFVNQAHNDLLQIVLEFGIFSLLIIVPGLIWVGRILFGSDLRGITVAVMIALAVALGHSLFDYPLRTISALSVVTVFCALLQLRTGERA